MIPKTQVLNNTKGSFMDLTFWVLTQKDPNLQDVGIATMNFDNTLTINGIQDGSTIYWGILVYKTAGTKVTYDCGLCKHVLNKTLD